MGFKTIFGIKKYRWRKLVNKFIGKIKTVFPQYPWNEFYKISEYFYGQGLSSTSYLLALGLKGSEAKMYAIDNFRGNASEPLARMRYQK